MTHNFQNEFEDIVLKPLEQKNIEDLRNLRNKEENRKCFIYQKEITKEEQENWYKKYSEKEEDLMFSAFLKENEEYYYIGSSGIVWSVGELFSDEDNDNYNLGNYFKTEEEAQKIIDSKEWQEFWEKVRAGEIGGDE